MIVEHHNYNLKGEILDLKKFSPKFPQIYLIEQTEINIKVVQKDLILKLFF